jgi:hypothetical protein
MGTCVAGAGCARAGLWAAPGVLRRGAAPGKQQRTTQRTRNPTRQRGAPSSGPHSARAPHRAPAAAQSRPASSHSSSGARPPPPARPRRCPRRCWSRRRCRCWRGCWRRSLWSVCVDGRGACVCGSGKRAHVRALSQANASSVSMRSKRCHVHSPEPTRLCCPKYLPAPSLLSTAPVPARMCTRVRVVAGRPHASAHCHDTAMPSCRSCAPSPAPSGTPTHCQPSTQTHTSMHLRP